MFMNRDTGENMTCCNRTRDTDCSVRFQNPNGAPEVSPEDLVDTTMPPNWPYDLSEIPGGLENESFIVWFRVSAFPNSANCMADCKRMVPLILISLQETTPSFSLTVSFILMQYR